MSVADLLGQPDQMFEGGEKEVVSSGLAFSAEDAHTGK